MNEVELIRSQLAVEKRHATAVAHALAAAALGPGGTEAFFQAGVDYLAWVLSRFEEREQVFHDLLRDRFPADQDPRRDAEAALALRGTSRQALAKLETAFARAAATNGSGDASHPWVEFRAFFDEHWSPRRDALDEAFAALAKISDWRSVASIDADAIFDERKRYTRVRTALPPGVEMPNP